MKPRTRARSIALQAPLRNRYSGHPPELVLNERLSETPLEDNLGDFPVKLYLGYCLLSKTLIFYWPNMP